MGYQRRVHGWSSQTVSYKSAQPGDIIQFASYSEKYYLKGGGWSSKSTDVHHTAVVTKAYVSSSDSLQVEEQNPKAAHSSDYHFGSKTGGSYVVYRFPLNLLNNSQWVSLE